jgi:hypothetical protein
MPYNEDIGEIPGYHLDTRIRRGPVIAGSVMLGTGYLISAVAAGAAVESGDTELAPLFVPVAGPFITLGTIDWSSDFGGLAFAIIGVPLILDGLLQTGGAILLIAGIASPKKVLVRDGVSTTETDTTPRLRIGGRGISIEGRF